MSEFAPNIDRPGIPRADGFATAMERLLASGGGMKVSGFDRKAGRVFTKGRLKGLTMEEAVVEGRKLWASAPDAVKDGYARHAQTGLLAPSERMAAELERGNSSTSSGVKLDDGRTYESQRGGHLSGRVYQHVTMPQHYQAGQNTPQIRLDSLQVLPTGPDRQQLVNPAATPGAGRGTPVENSRIAGIERPPQVHATGMPGPWKVPMENQPNSGAPSRSLAIERPAGSKRINPLTAKPFGWDPRDEAQATSTAPTYAGPRPGAGRYDPELGFVPSAVPVSEAPLSQAEYDQLGRDIKTTIEPFSPEMSAALGRRRTFEDEQMAAKAKLMDRERLGPSPAERAEADRRARRALDRRVAASYGRVS